MSFQYLIQTFACAYAYKKHSVGMASSYAFPHVTASVLWLLSFAIGSAFGSRMRGRPALYIPLWLVFMLS